MAAINSRKIDTFKEGIRKEYEKQYKSGDLGTFRHQWEKVLKKKIAMNSLANFKNSVPTSLDMVIYIAEEILGMDITIKIKKMNK